MPDTYVYSTDPGKEVRVSKGSVINVIQSSERSPDYSVGVAVLGVIGTPANDRGVPNVPVVLSGIQDIFSRWGGFKPHVGDGYAAGYNGNVAAMLYRLLARDVVFQPVDLALKDDSIANDGVDLKATVARGVLAFTVEESDDVFSCAGHPFVANDTFQIVTLRDGTGVASFTTYHVIAPVVAGVSFKASSSSGGGSLTVTLDGTGTLVPLSVATPSYDALTLPAGTRLRRSARTFSITGANANELFTTDEPHGLAIGETVTIAGLTGGSGATAGAYVVNASLFTTTTFTLTGVTFTTDITAGTMTRLEGSFIVRTLEDVSWTADAYVAKAVRVAKVSGTVAAMNTLDGFHASDAPAAASALAIATTATTVPDDTDAAEILARYQKALDEFNRNGAGQSATVLITDRTEAAISDALATHCSEASSEGVFRICVVAPPVGTTAALAEGTSGNGVGRATLDGEFTRYVHPGWRRRFPLDSANLSAADDYKATFPGQAVAAAQILTKRPEENPASVDAEPFTSYGCAELELNLSRTEKVTHYAAHIDTAIFDRVDGRRVGAYRDGIMADGTKIARKRLIDFIAASLIERATPWHKRLASAANQKGVFDSCDTFLAGLKDPKDQRISGYELSVSFDGETEELTITADVVELGNMDIITIKLGVTTSGFTVLGEEG